MIGLAGTSTFFKFTSLNKIFIRAWFYKGNSNCAAVCML